MQLCDCCELEFCNLRPTEHERITYKVIDCPYYKNSKPTNADRIRAMSDEELAKWIDWLFGRCEWCDTNKLTTNECNDVECTSCILEWLKQPAEVDNG